MAKRIVAGETNPVLLWLYDHGWEDPDWGQTRLGQLLAAVAIYDLAGKIGDPDIAKSIQTPAKRAISKLSKNLVAEEAG